jgi:hypothetical protein
MVYPIGAIVIYTPFPGWRGGHWHRFKEQDMRDAATLVLELNKLLNGEVDLNYVVKE